MKRSILIIAILALTGCASVKPYESPAQSYRFSGDESPTSITGRVDQKIGLEYAYQLHVFFNGEPVIDAPLSSNADGDVTGNEWKGRKVSASCSTRQVSSSWNETRCIIFHGNERTVTLTF